MDRPLLYTAVVSAAVIAALPALVVLTDTASRPLDTAGPGIRLPSPADAGIAQPMHAAAGVAFPGIPESIARASNELGFAYYRHIYQEARERGDNILFSPLGMYAALSIMYEGADGGTAERMRGEFGFDPDPESRHYAMSRMAADVNAADEHTTLELASHLWFDEGLDVHDSYADTARETYLAGIRTAGLLDAGPEGISEWAGERAGGGVRDVMPHKAAGAGVRAVMLNTAHFEGEWWNWISDSIHYSRFNISPDEQTGAWFMEVISLYHYDDHGEFQVLKLPYEGNRFSMLMILPDYFYGIEPLRDVLTVEHVREWQMNPDPQIVRVIIPKLEVTDDHDLEGYLSDLGIVDSRSKTTRDHPEIAETGQYLDAAVHSAQIGIDVWDLEPGATKRVFAHIPEWDIPVFHADRPFMFFVMDDESGAIVLMGIVLDPSKSPPPSAGSLYVADAGDGEILAYSPAGDLRGVAVKGGSGGLARPWDVSFGPDGHMYVTDNAHGKIRKYDGWTWEVIDADWASTGGHAHGMEWDDGILHVATSLGVETFSESGRDLGFFGEAHRHPRNPHAEPLLAAYDVSFCYSLMYVADRAGGAMHQYSRSDGLYRGSISGPDGVDTSAASGVECGGPVYHTGEKLYQGGADPGIVNRFNQLDSVLEDEFAGMINAPYGMDVDSAGNLYVANGGGDNIIKISPGGTTSVLISGGLDGPRGVTVGPRFAASGASGQAADDSPANDAPEVELLRGGVALPGRFEVSSPVTLEIGATDAEGDVITLGLLPDMVPEESISLDRENNTVSIDPAGLEGELVFWIVAEDDAGNFERIPYVAVVPPGEAAGSLYVADTDDREILAYSTSGDLQGVVVPAGSGGLERPWDVSFGPDGHMYVTDNAHDKIRKYDGWTGEVIDADWASTSGHAYGMGWYDGQLYVATNRGIELIAQSGDGRGHLGDPHRSPLTRDAEPLLAAYDVAFCHGRMYVADRAGGAVHYYSMPNHGYIGSIEGPGGAGTPAASGVECGGSAYVARGDLYQSGADSGLVGRINVSGGVPGEEFAGMISEPHGLALDSLGSLHVANSGDDNIISIAPGGQPSVLISGGLDGPRGVTVGPRFAASGASGQAADDSPANDAPEVELLRGGGALPGRFEVSSPVTLEIGATDAEGDVITLGLLPDMVPEESISLDRERGTVSIDPAGLEGELVFWIVAEDDAGNFERIPYVMTVPAGGAAGG